MDNQKNSLAALLSLYKPPAYFDQQIDSLYAQSHPNLSIYASVDGLNADEDLEKIHKKFKLHAGKVSRLLPVHLLKGPNQGFIANFTSLLCNPEIKADYFAFCDQDDVWHENKLDHAIKELQKLPFDKPLLYCSRTRLIDKNNEFIGFSPLFKKPPHFKNALVQNIGGGNTMVFNRKARELLKEIGPVDVASHDWWVYMVVSGCGGHVIYDAKPKIDYRQHQDNLVGANRGWGARYIRFKQMLGGRFERWGALHVAALNKIKEKLTPENRELFDAYQEARTLTSPLARVSAIIKTGVYRQSIVGQIGLYVAAFLKKI